MSLLDIIAAAGEEFIGLRAVRGRASARESPAARHVSRQCMRATIASLIGLIVCWGVERLLPDTGGQAIAAVGVYVALGLALLSGLGWAYTRMAIRKATRGPRRDG
jgi:hypothetical protein